MLPANPKYKYWPVINVSHIHKQITNLVVSFKSLSQSQGEIAYDLLRGLIFKEIKHCISIPTTHALRPTYVHEPMNQIYSLTELSTFDGTYKQARYTITCIRIIKCMYVCQ